MSESLKPCDVFEKALRLLQNHAWVSNDEITALSNDYYRAEDNQEKARRASPASPAIVEAERRVIEIAKEIRHREDCIFWRPHNTGTDPWPCNCDLGPALAALRQQDAAKEK